jgi:hypothetical protein
LSQFNPLLNLTHFPTYRNLNLEDFTRFLYPYCEFISRLHAPAYFSGHRSVATDTLLVAYITKFFFWRNSLLWARPSSLSILPDHTQTHHTRYDFSGRVISSTQRPVPENIQHSQGIITKLLTEIYSVVHLTFLSYISYPDYFMFCKWKVFLLEPTNRISRALKLFFLIVVFPCMFIITQLLFQQNALVFYY